MRSIFVIFCAIILGINANAQVVIGSKFKPFSYDELVGPLLVYQQEYNKMSDAMTSLSNYIIDILGQDIDALMRSQMNIEYKRIEGFHKKMVENGDLRMARSGYNDVLKSVQKRVVEYNNRVAQERQRREREHQRDIEENRARQASQVATYWSGSGFALNNGYICTNYHVIDGAKSIEIHGVQGNFTTPYFARVVATDKYNDLAILQVNDSNFKGFGAVPYKVKTSMAEVGEGIFVLGYPMTTTMGDEIKLTNGIISSRTGFQGDVSLYQISAPIQPGNSGGPLFDNQGNLIGIVSAKHAGAENVGYAIKASYLRNLMESSLTEDVLPKNNAVSSLPLTGKVKQLKNFVYFIKCSSVVRPSYKETNTSSESRINSSSNVPRTSDNDNKIATYSIDSFSYETMSKSCRIDKIESTAASLRVTFTYKNPDVSGSCSIASSTAIKYVSKSNSITTKYLSGNINIPLAPEKYEFKSIGECLTFTLIFPPIPEDTVYFNIIEKNDWKFYNIRIK